MQAMIQRELHAHQETLTHTIETMRPAIEEALTTLISTLQRGNKILLCGNGGSAADAQHIAAELTGRYRIERQALPAIALSTDTSALTAIANDYGYDAVFERQVEALARKGDLLIGISTSGNSTNILRAIHKANAMGCQTLGLSGAKGGEMRSVCDLNLIIPSDATPRIQEMHIMLGHILCQGVDEAFA